MFRKASHTVLIKGFFLLRANCNYLYLLFSSSYCIKLMQYVSGLKFCFKVCTQTPGNVPILMSSQKNIYIRRENIHLRLESLVTNWGGTWSYYSGGKHFYPYCQEWGTLSIRPRYGVSFPKFGKG